MDSVGVELPLHQSARAFFFCFAFCCFFFFTALLFFSLSYFGFIHRFAEVSLMARKRMCWSVYCTYVDGKDTANVLCVCVIILLLLLSAECAPSYTTDLSASSSRRPTSVSHWLRTSYRLCHTVFHSIP